MLIYCHYVLHEGVVHVVCMYKVWVVIDHYND